MGADRDDLTMTIDDAVIVGTPFVVGSSVTGPSHHVTDTPCQDAWAARVSADEVVIAVADGLGSARRAHDGARIAVDAAVSAGAAGSDEERVNAMVAAARAALEAERGEDALRDLACTIIVAIARAGGCTVAHIGDGGVVVETDPAFLLLSAPAESEYVDVVDPLTADDWASSIRVSSHEGSVRSVTLFTDGCQRAALAFDDGARVAHAPFLEPLVAFARAEGPTDAASAELERFLAGPKMSDHSDDDKTLVIAVLP